MPIVPVITNLNLNAAAGVLAGVGGANFVLKVVHPLTSAGGGFVGVSADPTHASQTELITHQIPLQNTNLDVGGTVTAILRGVSI